MDKTTFIEFCANCKAEVEVVWSVKQDGFQAYCPYCGNRLMLCSECCCRGEYGEFLDDCDFNAEKDTCRFCKTEREVFPDAEKIKGQLYAIGCNDAYDLIEAMQEKLRHKKKVVVKVHKRREKSC